MRGGKGLSMEGGLGRGWEGGLPSWEGKVALCQEEGELV